MFLAIGASLLGLQEAFKQIFSIPSYIGRLYLIYVSGIRMLSDRQDDANKGFALNKELREFSDNPPVEAGFIPRRLAECIRELVSTFDAWKIEKPVSVDTRTRIKELYQLRWLKFLRRP